jgi:hypothetical protein
LALEDQQNSEEKRIPWHPAFVVALMLELEQYQDVLEFTPEYQLTLEPLKIDVVVIKKTKHVVIKKNIAAIFLEHNLLEFKSPTDHVSVDDFYKVYGYACLYASLNQVPITGLTITFVESRHPRDLLTHLGEVRHYAVENRSPGIYTVEGDVMPIQIIDSRELPEDENLWLKNLDNELDVPRINRITVEIDRQGKAARIGAYLDVIARANPEMLQEAMKMSESTLTLEQVFENVGWAAKWEARGEARGEVKGEAKKALKIAHALLNKGWTSEEVAETTELDLEIIKSLTRG